MFRIKEGNKILQEEIRFIQQENEWKTFEENASNKVGNADGLLAILARYVLPQWLLERIGMIIENTSESDISNDEENKLRM